MQRVVKLLILVSCFAVAVSFSPAQPPQGKKDGPKGGPKGGMSDEAMVADIISRMMAFDKNNDDKLTRDEITDARLLRLFDRADANKDGVVTREELTALAKQMVAEMASEGGGKGGPGGPGGKGGPGGGKGGPGGPGGPGGKGGPPPMPGQILSPMFRDMLQLSENQKQQLDALQSEVDTKMANILTDEQKKQLKEMSSQFQKGPKKGG